VIVYPTLGAGSFILAWLLGEVGRLVDRRRRAAEADVVRIVGGYAAAEEPITEPPAVEVDPWPLPPVHTCEPPDWYVPCLDRPDGHDALTRVTDEFRAIVARSFPLRSASYVESAT
jgi:hypothetical protein